MATLTTRTETPRRLDLIAGGWAGLVFVALLIIQNLVRASAPGFGATPHSVTTYFLDHHTAAVLPLMLFPVGMIAVLTFAAAVRNLARSATERFWSTLGGTAVIVIAGLFGIINIIEIAFVIDGRALLGAPAAAGALWTVHAAAFGFNLTAIGIALVGLSRVAVSHHLIPPALAVVAVAGAACLVAASLTTLALVQGAPTLYLGFVGFIVWGVFLVVAGVALVRSRGQ